MNELVGTLRDVLRSLVRFRWIALAVAALISVAGWVHVHQLEDVYEGRARVFVDSNRVLGPLLKGLAIQADVQQRVTLMSRTLLNRPNLEKLIRTTELGTDAVTELEREQLISSVRGRISLAGTRGNSSIYTVTYRDSDRDTARRVVQALLNVFIEETIGDKREDSRTAQQFLDQQIEALERRLGESERRLSDFKRENAGKTPGESGGYYARLATATARAQATRLELAEARNRLQLLSRRAAQEAPTLRGDAYSEASPAEFKLAAQRDELDALLVRFTERHPRVSQLRASIAATEAQVEAERDAPVRSRPGAMIANPAYEQVRASLTETEARVAELEVRTVEYDRQVEALQATVDSIPLVEAELARLDRDYETVREQYQALLERRESARLSEQVEQNVDDIQFRVIDPPFVPVRPTAPKKWLMSAAVFAAGVGAGGALAFGLALMRPVYYRPDEIAARTGHVVLGSVAAWRTPHQRRAERLAWLVWTVAAASLAAMCVLVVLVERDLLDVATLERATGLPLGDGLDALGSAAGRAVDAVRGLFGA